MSKLVINGGTPLRGQVRISGSKNASLPIMAAALVTRGRTILHDVPVLRDVATMAALLSRLGVRVERTAPHTLEMEVVDESNCTAPSDLVEKMRASVCVLGPLVAKRGLAKIRKPGGCVIGDRPIDLHLKGLGALGCEVSIDGGHIVASARRLKGRTLYLGGPYGSTVLGTANVMMAATLAEGTTVVEHAACEPEVQDLAAFLNACGARISGIGSATLTIEGVSELHGAEHTIIPDRIEAGTFVVAAAVTQGALTLENICAGHMQAVVDVARETGMNCNGQDNALSVQAPGRARPTNFATLPYPGIPTDMQPQLTALLSLAGGTSIVTERVHPDRFTHVAELNRLGAQISREGAQAVVSGVVRLSGAPVTASDLRAGAGLVLAGLAADGTTEVHELERIDRGYERIEEKLQAVGADIRRSM